MGAAISFVTGKGALAHNNREFIHDNVDESRIENNINYKEESLKEAYDKCFGEAVEEYNQRQTRNDRKIKNYMKRIKNSGNNEKLFYENVVQIGDKYSHGFGSGNEQEAIDILDEYARNFQKRNPNLYVFNMKMHLDEASPHLHIDYIPVASGYKRGMSTRNSLTKAHENMGIPRGTGRNDNSTMKWQEREREYIKEIAKEHDLEIVDKKTDRKHLTVDEYKIYAEQIEKQYDKFMNLKVNIKPSKIPFTNKVFLEENDFKKISNNAKYNYLAEKTVSKYTKKLDESLKKKEVELNLLADKLKDRDVELRYKRIGLNSDHERLKHSLNKKIEKYENLYKDQLSLNKTKDSLEEENKKLKDEIRTKGTTITLNSQKINSLKREVDIITDIFTDQITAINSLVFSNDAIDLPEKEKTLIQALDKHSQRFLKSIGREDKVEYVRTKAGPNNSIKAVIKEIEAEKKLEFKKTKKKERQKKKSHSISR